jgi:hypothetical protein
MPNSMCNNIKKTMIKKIFFMLLLVTFSGVAQQKKDYSKFSSKDLIKELENRDSEFKKLKDDSSKEKTSADNANNSKSDSDNKKIAELESTIKQINEVFLWEIFENKYIKNTDYFKETDLSIEDNTKKFTNSDILIKSVKTGYAKDAEIVNVCNKARDFNNNYLRLFEVQKTILTESYNDEKVKNALKEIEKLPALDFDSKLGATKQKLIDLLKNYLANTCDLKEKLDKMKKADQSPVIKQKYAALEKDAHFKDYPYLVQVIKDIKNSLNSYTEDDLQPCLAVEKAESVQTKAEKSGDKKLGAEKPDTKK